MTDPLTVTLTAPDGTAQTVSYVLKRAETRRDAGDDPAIVEEVETVFHLWSVPLAGTVPLKGYHVTTADGAAYHVEQVETHTRGHRYRLTCTRDRTP